MDQDALQALITMLDGRRQACRELADSMLAAATASPALDATPDPGRVFVRIVEGVFDGKARAFADVLELLRAHVEPELATIVAHHVVPVVPIAHRETAV